MLGKIVVFIYIVPNDVKFKEPVYTITETFKGHYNPLGNFLEGGHLTSLESE